MGGDPATRLLLLAALLGGVVAGASAGPVDATTARPSDAFQVGDRFDRATFTIRVFENGSARWVFRYERPLSNDTEVEQFRSFADRFRTTQTPLYRDFRNQSRALVRAGADTTGRAMTATDFARTANVTTVLGNRIGYVEMAFTWVAFGVERPNGVVIGDVFQGELYIGPSQALVVEPAGDLRFESVAPAPTSQEDPDSLTASGSVTWRGERTFSDGRPRVELRVGTAGATGSPGATATSDPGGAAGQGFPAWAIGVLGIVLVAAALIVLRRRGLLPGGVASDAAGPGPAGSGEAPAVDGEALMDDDERIHALLEANEGRMRQSAIVEETGWSKSKVSMVLSEMEDADEVTKLRVGRENIVSLPGKEPDAADSPFDDEG